MSACEELYSKGNRTCFGSKYAVISILALSLAVFTGPVSQATIAIQSALALDTVVYADGYYDNPSGLRQFGGARSDMESADPQIRDGQWSIMRVAITPNTIRNPGDGSFAEIGWAKDPTRLGTSRCVYAGWQTTRGTYDSKIFTDTCLTDFATHDYRVAVKNNNPTQWSFIFDGVVKHALDTGFSRGQEVGCGGEAYSPQNAIGIAACWNVRYKSNDLTTWIPIPSHQYRISSGYWVHDLSANSWQVGGNN